MLLKTLREEVLEANLELVRRGLVLYTFGNASGIDRSEGLVAIKPSGVPYEELDAGADGDHRSHRKNRRRNSSPVFGLAHSSGVVQTFSQPSAESRIRTPNSPPPGLRPRRPFRASAPRTPIIFTAPFPSPRGSAHLRSTVTTSWKPAPPSAAYLPSSIPIAIPAVLVAGHAPFCWGPTAADGRPQRGHSRIRGEHGVPHIVHQC